MTLLFYILMSFTTFQSQSNDLSSEVILLIGDSQMAGKYSTMGPRLEKILINRQAEVIRLGVGASGSNFWNRTLDGERTKLTTRRTKRWTLKYLKSLKPTQIVVSLGGNDSFFGKYGKHIKVVRHYHLKFSSPLMKKLKTITPNVSWFGPAHRWKSEHNLKKRARIKRGRQVTSEILKEISILNGVRFVSMLNWVVRDNRLKNLRPRQIRYDKVHYKDSGKITPATWYAEAIAERIKKNN